MDKISLNRILKCSLILVTLIVLVIGGGAFLKFTPVIAATEVVTPLSPEGILQTNQPTFSWTKDPGMRAVKYQLLLVYPDGTEVKTWYKVKKLVNNNDTYSIKPVLYLAAGVYQWQVRYYIGGGFYSDWSSKLSFEVPYKPETPQLFEPSGTIQTKTPKFRWGYVSGATHYRLWVNGKDGLIYNRWIDSATANCKDPGSVCEFVLPKEVSFGSYEWMVRAKSEIANQSLFYGDWSSKVNFIITDQIIEFPTPTIPSEQTIEPSPTVEPTATGQPAVTQDVESKQDPDPTQTPVPEQSSGSQPTPSIIQSPGFTPTPGPTQIAGSAYFVSPSGNDNNPGTIEKPWRTIGKAVSRVVAGETVYIRGGVYQESVVITRLGTSEKPIKVLAYPGETPVIDGNNYTLPGSDWGVLLNVAGEYITVSGIEVRYSRGMGVVVTGQHNTIDKVKSHHHQQNGILVTGDYNVVENSEVWSNCMSNVNGGSRNGWASGLSAARSPEHVVMRKNVVYGNWGEGLSVYEANEVILEDNIVHDNWSANVYISDATNIVVQRNFVYASGVMSGGSQVGIMMGDERYSPASANIKVINNIVYGTNRNFYWWQGTQGGGMNNVLIAHNTFVNSVGSAGVIIASGTHQGVEFRNNLVQQDGTLPVIITYKSSGLVFSNNLWSKVPTSAASGSGDVIGDAKLAKAGSPYQSEWYVLTSGSPAIDKAISIAGLLDDYFRNSRGNPPDIGANEYLK